MAPRYWKITIEGKTVTVVAGTREAAEKIAAKRIAKGRVESSAVRAAAALLALLLLPSEAVAASTAREVAEALRSDPVYVAPGQAGQLTVAQRGRLRLRIVDRDIGRIQIAVV